MKKKQTDDPCHMHFKPELKDTTYAEAPWNTLSVLTKIPTLADAEGNPVNRDKPQATITLRNPLHISICENYQLHHLPR